MPEYRPKSLCTKGQVEDIGLQVVDIEWVLWTPSVAAHNPLVAGSNPAGPTKQFSPAAKTACRGTHELADFHRDGPIGAIFVGANRGQVADIDIPQPRSSAGLSETFGYDVFNRLTTRNGPTIVACLSSGNIPSKDPTRKRPISISAT